MHQKEVVQFPIGGFVDKINAANMYEATEGKKEARADTGKWQKSI